MGGNETGTSYGTAPIPVPLRWSRAMEDVDAHSDRGPMHKMWCTCGCVRAVGACGFYDTLVHRLAHPARPACAPRERNRQFFRLVPLLAETANFCKICSPYRKSRQSEIGRARTSHQSHPPHANTQRPCSFVDANGSPKPSSATGTPQATPPSPEPWGGRT